MKIGALDTPAHAEFPGTGMAVWTNPINRFTVLAIHYTADPSKRSASWKEHASQGYRTADWNQEYELSFESWAGRPVFAAFRKATHVAKQELTWTRQRYMWRAWDIGIHAVVWGQLCNSQLYLYACRQIVGAFPKDVADKYRANEIDCSGLGIFIDRIKELSAQMFPGASWKDVVDPSAWNDTVVREGRTPFMVFIEHGIHAEPAETNDPYVRISAVEDWLSTMVRGEAGLQIDPSDQLLIDTFAGGYQFEKRDGSGSKPSKNHFSHCGDCVGYLALALKAPRGGKVQREDVVTRGLDPARYDFGRATRARPNDEYDHWTDY